MALLGLKLLCGFSPFVCPSWSKLFELCNSPHDLTLLSSAVSSHVCTLLPNHTWLVSILWNRQFLSQLHVFAFNLLSAFRTFPFLQNQIRASLYLSTLRKVKPTCCNSPCGLLAHPAEAVYVHTLSAPWESVFLGAERCVHLVFRTEAQTVLDARHCMNE